MGTFLLLNINYILSFAFIDAIVHCNVLDVWEFGPLGLCRLQGPMGPILRVSVSMQKLMKQKCPRNSSLIALAT